MDRIMKKVSSIKFRKKPRQLETDAAPSPPRPVSEDLERSDSSEGEDYPANSKINNHPKEEKKYKTEEDDHCRKAANSDIFSQTNNIYITNGTDIHIGNRYHYNIQRFRPAPHETTPSPQSSRKPPKVEPPTPKIAKTFNNREAACREDFVAIKSDVGPYWRSVAEKLGLSDSTVNEINQRYESKGNGEVFYRLMLKWTQCQPSSITTVGMLCEALWNSGETAAAIVLSDLHSDL